MLFLCCMILAGLQCSVVTAKAATGTVKIEITKDEIEEQGIDTVVQRALNEAREYATEENPYEITVPKGTYQLQHTLLVYSNTKLNLKGVTLYAEERKNVVHVGSLDMVDGNGATGHCYRNITIEGGIMDGGYHSGTVLKVGHASNFKMKGVTLRNVLNAHLMETGGVKGLTVKNCTFKNQISTSEEINYYEALQLDVLCSSHLAAYRSETLNTTDVLIDHCKFYNTPRGVGSHTAILNQPMTNITISNCTFQKMGSVAIQSLHWKNATIKNNVIKETPRAIACYLATARGAGTYLPSVVAAVGNTQTTLSDEYREPSKNMGLLIKDNFIATNAITDPYAPYERVAILVSGVYMDQQYPINVDYSGGIPLGDYCYSGVDIIDNTINTTGHGIRCIDVKNAVLSGNRIIGNATEDTTYYHGIQIMTKSNIISIRDNIIRHAVTNGIYVNRDSEVALVENNSITGSGKYGIGIESATVGTISNNSIKNTREKGIFIYNHAKTRKIRNNWIDRVSGAQGRGIHVCVSAIAGEVIGNSIARAGEYGILASSVSSIDLIKDNTVTDVTVKAVYATLDSAIKSGY